MKPIALVHLARASNGIEPFRTFLESYARHPAGADHELLIILKGFPDPLPVAYRELLEQHPHRAVAMPDQGLDLLPYFKVVAGFEYPWFAFLNSFSVIRCGGWLELLRSQAGQPGVGAAGAFGSWESLRTTWEEDNARAHFWKKLRPKFRARRQAMVQAFAPHPNPHLRTNAFLASRDVLARVRVPAIRCKADTHRFESGVDGLSSQILRMGMRLALVGRDGRAYGSEDWPFSRTFRKGDQGNALVSDNQTRLYDAAPPPLRCRLSAMAWGVHGDKIAPDEQYGRPENAGPMDHRI